MARKTQQLVVLSKWGITTAPGGPAPTESEIPGLQAAVREAEEPVWLDADHKAD